MPHYFDKSALRRMPRACIVVLSFLVLSALALAEPQSSPLVRIVGLEVVAGSGVLRMAVERRTHAPGVFEFNPAGCSLPRSPFNRNGTNTAIQSYDFQLEVSGRTSFQQHQVLDQIYGAFATSRMVRIVVSDELCSGNDRPVALGILVEH